MKLSFPIRIRHLSAVPITIALYSFVATARNLAVLGGRRTLECRYDIRDVDLRALRLLPLAGRIQNLVLDMLWDIAMFFHFLTLFSVVDNLH